MRVARPVCARYCVVRWSDDLGVAVLIRWHLHLVGERSGDVGSGFLPDMRVCQVESLADRPFVCALRRAVSLFWVRGAV